MNILEILPALLGMIIIGISFISLSINFKLSRKIIVILTFLFIVSGFTSQILYNHLSLPIISEIRGWLTLVLSIFGFTIAYLTYLNNQKQRRLENSFKLISLFKESLQKDDIEIWKEIFASSSESSGSEEGFFKAGHYGDYILKCLPKTNEDKYSEDFIIEEVPFEYLFSEGSPDNGAIQKMSELFDLISFQLLNQTVDEKLIYFELGQLMNTVKLWLSFIDNSYSNKSFLQEHFPFFSELYEKRIIQESWQTRTYKNCE